MSLFYSSLMRVTQSSNLDMWAPPVTLMLCVCAGLWRCGRGVLS